MSTLEWWLIDTAECVSETDYISSIWFGHGSLALDQYLWACSYISFCQEEEGEDISSEKEDEKEEEKEKEKDEDDDEDDGFFVPHGYLSDDEGDEDCEMTDEAKKKRLERRKKQVWLCGLCERELSLNRMGVRGRGLSCILSLLQGLTFCNEK